MTLSEYQRKFTKLVGQLILWAYDHGFELSLGEAWRTPEQSALNVKKGIGIANSLHGKRLAVDLNLFINGEFKTDTESYRPLGEYWKSLDKDCYWGGLFKDKNGYPAPDADHFSLSNDGGKTK